MMQFDPDRLYRVKAVADAMDVSPATVYRAIESGSLTAYRIGAGSGAVRIPGSAVSEFLGTCQEGQGQPRASP